MLHVRTTCYFLQSGIPPSRQSQLACWKSSSSSVLPHYFQWQRLSQFHSRKEWVWMTGKLGGLRQHGIGLLYSCMCVCSNISEMELISLTMLPSSITSCQGILITDISDHFLIIHINVNFTGTVQDVLILKRLCSVRNKHAFLDDLYKVDWNAICQLRTLKRHLVNFTMCY